MIPVQHLELVTLEITEDEEAGLKGTDAKAVLDECGQSVDGLAQVGHATGQIDAMRARQRQHNACTASRSN